MADTRKPDSEACAWQAAVAHMAMYAMSISILPEDIPLIAYNARDRADCVDHRRRVCYACRVDYRRGPGAAPASRMPNESFILGAGVSRFTPPMAMGKRNPWASQYHQNETNYDNPPTALTLDHLGLHYCGQCRLSWLGGNI